MRFCPWSSCDNRLHHWRGATRRRRLYLTGVILTGREEVTRETFQIAAFDWTPPDMLLC